MKNYPKVSTIILNWNGLEDTVECIESLKKITYSNYEIIVVDNASTKNDVEVLEEKYKDYIKIIKNKENLGFSEGNNVGIKYALDKNSDYILLLNNDTTVEPNFLEALVEEGENNLKIGILTPKINYYSNPNKIWLAGGYISKIRGSGFPIGDGKNENGFNKNRFITFTSACCMLIKNEVFRRIGLWDGNYFLYIEDTDFCKRTIDVGFKILYVANSKIYHKISVTTKKVSSVLPLYYTTRNRLYFSKKLLGGWFYIFFAYLFLTMCMKFIFWGMSNRKENIKSVIKAISDFLNKKMGKTEIFE